MRSYARAAGRPAPLPRCEEGLGRCAQPPGIAGDVVVRKVAAVVRPAPDNPATLTKLDAETTGRNPRKQTPARLYKPVNRIADRVPELTGLTETNLPTKGVPGTSRPKSRRPRAKAAGPDKWNQPAAKEARQTAASGIKHGRLPDAPAHRPRRQQRRQHPGRKPPRPSAAPRNPDRMRIPQQSYVAPGSCNRPYTADNVTSGSKARTGYQRQEQLNSSAQANPSRI